MKKLYPIRLIISFIVLLLIISAIIGIPIVKITDMQFSAVFSRLLFNFSIISLLIFLSIIILTLLFGRLYCALICPLGILQEFFALITRRKGDNSKNYPVKYFISAIVFFALISGSTIVLKRIDPYTIFSNAISLSLFGLIFVLLLLVLVFFKNRFFCSNICPVGAILGLLSKYSLFKINIDNDKCKNCKTCSKICPAGSINPPDIDSETCIKCLKCLSVCKFDAIKYSIKKEKIKFSPKRRELILSGALIAVCAIVYKSTKFISSKIKDIILPPGAISTDRMENKCFNCNLCIDNCPNKILTKSNDEYGAIHIDYKKGEGYCKFDCIECSKICPTGAIKKITLEEKQNTRIAMAILNNEKCTNCKNCILNCPKGAISEINNKIIINSNKCIGCAKCSKFCPTGAIDIYSIKEQKLI